MTEVKSIKCMQGMAVAPHAIAAQSAIAALREGGNAIEAMVAAATIAVVYPHMNDMGGDGQPQTMATIFDRILYQGMSPQTAVAAPRWLLGRTWGESSDTLKIESRLSQTTIDSLKRYDHDVEIPPYDDTMGHASAIILHGNGMLEGGVARW